MSKICSLLIRYLIVSLKSYEGMKIKVNSLSEEFVPKKHTFLEVIPVSLNVFQSALDTLFFISKLNDFRMKMLNSLITLISGKFDDFSKIVNLKMNEKFTVF